MISRLHNEYGCFNDNIVIVTNPNYFPCEKVKLNLLIMIIIYKIAYCCYVHNAQHAAHYAYIYTCIQQINDVIITLSLHHGKIPTSSLRNNGVIITLCVHRGWYTEPGHQKLRIDVRLEMYQIILKMCVIVSDLVY